MLKHAKRYIVTASVATAAGLAALAGVTAASASPVAPVSAGAPVSPARTAAVSGLEHFQLMSTSATASKGRVIAYGVFTGAAVDFMGNTTDTFKFRNGSFRVRHSQGHGTQSFNPRSCLIRINQHGTYSISHGTGRYKGITGHGKYRFSILALGAHNKNGKCSTSQSKPPVAFEQIIQASGPVHLG
jgi:hypothetical protein